MFNMKKQHHKSVDSSKSGYASNGPPQRRYTSVLDGIEDSMDISLLQRPLRTACAGSFQEAKRAYEDGTDEVRRLLLQECNLIYECNVCRNLFRSLANFISHKRVFCATSSYGQQHYSNGSLDQQQQQQQSSLIIQQATTPLDKDIENIKRSRSTGSSPTPIDARNFSKGNLRDISRVIERLRREKATRPSCGNSVLQLESVPSNNHAVYQTVKQQENDCASIKTEVNEVHHLLTNVQTVLGPDGKALTKNNYAEKCVDTIESTDVTTSEQEQQEGKITCEICSLTFQTEKTLKIHTQKKHSLSTHVFQCPACSLTFLQAAAVIRHLSKEHKKPTRRIRLMRENILKRCMQQGEVQPKGPSRELKRLQMTDNTAISAVNITNIREQRKIMSTCIYCEKSFERRAALSTHLLNCRAKEEAKRQKPPPPIKRSKLSEELCDDVNVSKNIDEQETQSVLDTQMIDTIEKSLQNEVVENEEDTNLLNKMFADLAEKQNFGTTLQTVTFDKLDMLDSESVSAENTQVADNESQEKELDDIDNEMLPTTQTADDDDDVEKLPSQSEDKNMLPDYDCDDEMASAQTNEQQQQKDLKSKDEKVSLNKEKKKQRNVPIEKQLKCRCKICNKQFNALSNLRRHISMFHYRARRFGCKLCDYRAFRRYDIVNHLGFVHKIDGDREKIAQEYLNTHDCKYSKDDVDGDIVLVTDEHTTAAVSGLNENEQDDNFMITINKVKVIKTYEKRVKRKKIELMDADAAKDAIEQTTPVVQARNKLRRSRNIDLENSTQNSANAKDGEKRPIRKRVKAENKDFVYDLPRFLKSGDAGVGITGGAVAGSSSAQTIEGVARSKRRQQSIDNNDSRLNSSLLITAADKERIRGATQRIMLKLINEGRAVSATLPELPAQRPQMRTRHPTQIKREEQNEQQQQQQQQNEGTNIMKTEEVTSLENEQRKSLIFNNSFLEKIAKRTAAAAANNNAASVEEHNTINKLMRKMDAVLHKQNDVSSMEENAVQKNVTNAIDSQTEITYKTPNGKPCTEHASPPSPPRKRIAPSLPPPPPAPRPLDHYSMEITLESLLRTALQN